MKVYIQNDKVVTKNLELSLYMTRMAEYSTKAFKLKGKDEIGKIESEIADNRWHIRTVETKLK